jgi:DDB1- and CUL4-associated factor 13
MYSSSIDHHWSDPVFATASNLVQIWDETKYVFFHPTPTQPYPFKTTRSAPISNLTFPTSTETITSVRFNLSESSVLASIGSDRTFTLYDIRTGKAERRVVMQVIFKRLAFASSNVTHHCISIDAKQLTSMVAYIPDHDLARIRRPQSLHI